MKLHPTAVFASQMDKAAYLEKLRAKNPLLADLADVGSVSLELAVIFGPTDGTRKLFPPDQVAMIEWAHEEYQAGRARPEVGSDSDAFFSLVESFVGGRPRPEQAEKIIPGVVEYCLGVLKRGPEKMPFSDGTTKKRDDFLERLEREGKV